MAEMANSTEPSKFSQVGATRERSNIESLRLTPKTIDTLLSHDRSPLSDAGAQTSRPSSRARSIAALRFGTSSLR